MVDLARSSYYATPEWPKPGAVIADCAAAAAPATATAAADPEVGGLDGIAVNHNPAPVDEVARKTFAVQVLVLLAVQLLCTAGCVIAFQFSAKVKASWEKSPETGAPPYWTVMTSIFICMFILTTSLALVVPSCFAAQGRVDNGEGKGGCGTVGFTLLNMLLVLSYAFMSGLATLKAVLISWIVTAVMMPLLGLCAWRMRRDVTPNGGLLQPVLFVSVPWTAIGVIAKAFCAGFQANIHKIGRIVLDSVIIVPIGLVLILIFIWNCQLAFGGHFSRVRRFKPAQWGESCLGLFTTVMAVYLVLLSALTFDSTF